MAGLGEVLSLSNAPASELNEPKNGDISQSPSSHDGFLLMENRVKLAQKSDRRLFQSLVKSNTLNMWKGEAGAFRVLDELLLHYA